MFVPLTGNSHNMPATRELHVVVWNLEHTASRTFKYPQVPIVQTVVKTTPDNAHSFDTVMVLVFSLLLSEYGKLLCTSHSDPGEISSFSPDSKLLNNAFQVSNDSKGNLLPVTSQISLTLFCRNQHDDSSLTRNSSLVEQHEEE